LSVNCTIVATADEFYEKLASEEYPFVFVATGLYQKIKKTSSRMNKNSKIVLITEFGKSTSEQKVTVLHTPIYATPVADILNGVADSLDDNAKKEVMQKFIAPDARILLVDDININLRVAKGLLLPYEMKVDFCLSGAEAIQAVKSTRYDLVFMDHMMPKMDGIKATSLIRGMGGEDPYYISLPIIALTANAVSGMREMFLENGFNDFLSKPISLDEMDAVLEKWIPKEKQKKKIINIVIECNKDITFEIEGLDTKKGIAATGGKINNYMQILNIFLEDAKQKMIEIKACLKTKNLPLFTTYVHALKSASANIGALKLSKAAEKIEMAGIQGDFTYIETHTPQFLMDLERLLVRIKEAIAEENQEQQFDTADMELLKEELSALRSALNALDPVMIKNATGELRELTQKTEKNTGVMVENILQKVLMGEYDEAAELIGSLLGEIA